ncbi:MAG TPA: peptidase M48 [Marinilabiliaceae bacterium]|nr:peptidase M48 [Marinilabiliaceae bacterium]
MKILIKHHRISMVLVMSIALGAFIWACATVPITGRRQLNLVSDAEINAMSFNQYDEFIKGNPLSSNKVQSAQIKKVGANLANAVEQYFSQNNLSSQIADFAWEFNLVADPTPNAWCMPGGKVVFYEGIMPICQDENGIAVVMGHEIAHAVAKHGSERMSQQIGTEMASSTLSALLAEKPEQTRNIFMTAFGIGTQLGVMLPYSRTHEVEADRLGLIFMAMAGYDPSTAVAFWTRMSEMSGGGSSLEFLSTHPSDATRIRNLQNALPEAMQNYKK